MRERFPRQITALGGVFGLLRRFGDESGLQAPLLLELGLVIEELFTNQVRHARPGGDAIEVRVDLQGAAVRVVIVDDDVDPFDPCTHPVPESGTVATSSEPGGRGIQLVRELCDSMQYDYEPERRRSRITIEMQRES